MMVVVLVILMVVVVMMMMMRLFTVDGVGVGDDIRYDGSSIATSFTN